LTAHRGLIFRSHRLLSQGCVKLGLIGAIMPNVGGLDADTNLSLLRVEEKQKTFLMDVG